MRRQTTIIILISIVCAGAFLFVVGNRKKNVPPAPIQEENAVQVPDAAGNHDKPDVPQAVPGNGSSQEKQDKMGSSDTKTYGKVQQDVPFLVQAPFGNWSDPVFQNACEEASMVMAMGWVNGVPAISPEDGQKQIKDIVAFEDSTFGYYTDTDIHDMEKIFREYFHYDRITAQENITLADIKDELQKGYVVLVPAFGQALGNPNYTSPGPVAHMLVIIGYDPAARELITNDTGTKRGSAYRYNENILFDAVWEYPSGRSVPKQPQGELKKGMLVVQPK